MSVARRLPADTDELPEGSTNQYHTSARAVAAIEADATLDLNDVNVDGLTVGSAGQFEFDVTASAPTIDITGNDSGSGFWELDGTGQMRFHSIRKSGLNGLLEFGAQPADGTGNSLVRFGRYVNTTGNVSMQILAGDGTSTAGAIIYGNGAGDTYFCTQGGNFGIGAVTPNAALQVDNSVIGATYAFRMQCDPGFATPAIQVDDIDNGTGDGPYIFVGHNSNATTAAPGALLLKQSDGGVSTIWPDDSNNLRIGQLSGGGVNSTEKSSGTVIGTQTSSRKFKDMMGRVDNDEPVRALQRIVRTATSAIHNFTYKAGDFNGQLFRGIVIEDAPWYGMDKDDEHPLGKSLNEIDLLGDLTMSVAKLYQLSVKQSQRISELEKRVEELENA